MMCVAPAWKLQDFLDRPEVVQMRQQREREWAESARREPVAVLDAAADQPDSPDATADLMGRLVRVPKEEADEVHRGHQ